MMITANSTAAHTVPGPLPSLGERVRHSKALLPTMAVLLVTVAALGATLAVKSTGAEGTGPGQPVATAQAVGRPLPQSTAPVAAHPPLGTGQAQAPVVTKAPVTQPRAPQVVAQAAPPVCRSCGVVESVVAVKRQAPVEGIAGSQVTAGHVAGGVIGGLLGNQVGHGGGRAAATVLGAAGGAYAGNAIQKNMSTYTAYQMRIRMHDGTVRTVEQRNALAAGSQVVLDGHSARLAQPRHQQG